MLFRHFYTPIGECAIIYRKKKGRVKVIRILLPNNSTKIKIHQKYSDVVEGDDLKIIQLVDEIKSYFDGGKKKISMALLDTSICYSFQLKVLKTERIIPFGKTVSYGWLARQLGTRAYRAVGNALARNPFPIVIPCHRTVKSDRTLGVFQGGLDMKRKLLKLEGVEFDLKGRVCNSYFMK